MAVVTIDSYSESNYDGAVAVYSAQPYCTQSFTGDGSTLSSVKLYLRQSYGSPMGNCDVGIYSHTGTYGTTSAPGSLLMRSDVLDVAAIGNINYELIEFTFSGEEDKTLEDGTYYVLVFSFAGGDVYNRLGCGLDSSSPAHSGNAGFDSITGYQTKSDWDLCFYIYGRQDTPVVGTKYPVPAFKKT